ncbi:MAG: SDR family NAD(P)-dependent oxidoreductase [Methanobrevibacter sp.]|uniref:SDR family NAD(P)-dependent oxidoreductase n=1 Tax=Methanobrevibacter sp. TaxID=66852 RepID=UPI0026DF4F6F|nr:SDR family NAD(P)-dependent oxidoreductase [Methanobrevibacter sp.]MDO5848350.1 SDR family NAD(P)-dependent oxidoreductase [Methanobrevibacter sp.]
MLKNKVAVITGGTRGIGYATAKLFLDNGCKVIIFGSRAESVDKALSQLNEENPNYPVEGYYPNLNDYEEVEKTILAIAEKYGKIDILINNAGISSSTPIDQYTVEEFEKIINLNVVSMFKCIRATVPIMKEQGEGVILNTSSMVSISGQPSGVGYPTSKFAVNGMTLSLARELGKDNIRVNAVAPGVTETDMFKSLPEPLIEGIVSKIPLGRVGKPEDIANAFLYLASDMASYVTGEVLSVDGACRS